jgi:hypothetical protein
LHFGWELGVGSWEFGVESALLPGYALPARDIT